MNMRRHWILFAVSLVVVASTSLQLSAQAPVTYERLLNAAKEPQNYLTYGGDYSSTRYSTLTQITPAKAAQLAPQWSFKTAIGG